MEGTHQWPRVYVLQELADPGAGSSSRVAKAPHGRAAGYRGPTPPADKQAGRRLEGGVLDEAASPFHSPQLYFLIEVDLIYSAVLIAAVQRGGSVTHTHILFTRLWLPRSRWQQLGSLITAPGLLSGRGPRVPEHTGSAAAARGLGCSAACGILVS